MKSAPIGWKDWLLGGGFFALGVGLHQRAARWKMERQARGYEVNAPHGVVVGAMTAGLGAAAAMGTGRREVGIAGASLGFGIALDDMWWHLTEKQPEDLPVALANERPLGLRWHKVIDIDDRLSQPQQERIMLEFFPQMARQANPRDPGPFDPAVTLPPAIRERWRQANEYLLSLLGTRHPIQAAIGVQRFFHAEMVRKGGYEDDEGNGTGWDRFRLLPQLLDGLAQTGRLQGDCDDASLALWGLMNHLGYGAQAGAIVVSQWPEPSPFHHILPAVWDGGRWWAVECIVEKPPMPLAEIERLFGQLTRVAVVRNEGHLQPLRRTERGRWAF